MVWPGERRSYALGAWLCLRLLGLCYLAAFWSLGVQVVGLIGQDGVLPAQEVMTAARQWAEASDAGLLRYLAVPTVFWLGVSDAWLTLTCLAGAILSVALVAGVAAPLVLPTVWLLYLSFVTVTREFLSFQWDTLLLETGLIAIGLAPWTLFHRPTQEPPAVARWTIWWLLIRLMFASGFVKLASGDPLWRDLSALTVHFETQPLPTPVGWYAHQLPAIVLQIGAAALFAIELVAPWLIVVGPRARRVAGAAFVLLMLCIGATGNYAFFNLLTVALSCTLWSTSARTPTAPAGRRGRSASPRPGWPHRWAWVPAVVIALVTVPASVATLAGQLGVASPSRPLLGAWQAALRPFRSVNTYGLFAVMSSSRPELTIEGSLDGQHWEPFVFEYKPGDPRDAPRWVAPHQPRLDWHMWFAALDRYEASEWLERLCRRLLEGSPAVAALLREAPFAGQPPAFIRVMRAEYRMVRFTGRNGADGWWTAGPPTPYSPVLTRSAP